MTTFRASLKVVINWYWILVQVLENNAVQPPTFIPISTFPYLPASTISTLRVIGLSDCIVGRPLQGRLKYAKHCYNEIGGDIAFLMQKTGTLCTLKW